MLHNYVASDQDLQSLANLRPSSLTYRIIYNEPKIRELSYFILRYFLFDLKCSNACSTSVGHTGVILHVIECVRLHQDLS